MTLKELVEKYDGDVLFEVGRAIPGGVEDVVEFYSTDHAAIKDDILNSTVAKYTIATSSTTRVTSIKAVLEATVTEEVPAGNSKEV